MTADRMTAQTPATTAAATRGRLHAVMLTLMSAIGVGSVVLQLYLNMTRHLEHSPLWRLIDYLSYFTNTTAILGTAVAIAALNRPASRMASSGVVTATAIYMLVVAATYQWLLRTEQHGLSAVANIGVHQLLPTMAVALWLFFTPKAALKWRQPLAWVGYPAGYIAWILARGAIEHRYPYFFADVDKLGYPRALQNGAAFLLVFYVLGLLAVAVGRVLPMRRFSEIN
jgi:hypothetical protein